MVNYCVYFIQGDFLVVLVVFGLFGFFTVKLVELISFCVQLCPTATFHGNGIDQVRVGNVGLLGEIRP
jgi:hypothetical protein